MALFKKKPPAADSETPVPIHKGIAEADFIPYACHWDARTLVTRNGELLQTIFIPGLSAGQSSAEENGDFRSRLREAILSGIDSRVYAIWIHTVRRKKNLVSGGKFKRDFAGYLDRFWNDNNDWEHQFSNAVYVTIVHEAQDAKLFDPHGFMRGILPHVDIRYRERFLDESLIALNAVVEKIVPLLEGYGARRLGIVQRDGTYYSELNAFLGKLITSVDADVPVTDSDLAHTLTDYDIMWGHNAMEIRPRETGKKRYAALLTIKEYREISVETLEGLLRAPAEFIISECFHYAPSAQILKAFEYQKELFTISKAATLSERIGLPDIFASNQGRPTDFGQHQMSVFLPADSVKAMENAVTKVSAALSMFGMIPMREDLLLEECYRAQLPANFEFIRRMRPINTARLGGFANLSNAAGGKSGGSHWGAAVATFWTASHIPYFFNFHVQDNGHTLLIGPPSSGKTVLLNFLLAQTRKFDGKLFFFDTGRSSEIFLRSLGGAYYNLCPKADARAYAQLSLNPFQLDDTPATRDFLRSWLPLLAGQEDKAMAAACDKAVASVMQRPKAERELRLCAEALRAENPALAELFMPWTGQGAYASFFDHASDTVVFSDKVYGFEMLDVLKHPAAVAPVMFYLLHRIEQALDGMPAIIVMDEVWMLLDHPLFTPRLSEWLNRLKAKNAMVIFATEHMTEAGKSALTPLLLPHMATQLYLPDENADSFYMDAFRLAQSDVAFLSVMNTEDRHFLLKQAEEALVIELNLSGMSDIIAVLSATPDHLDVMQQVIEAQGLQPSQWMPKFLERI